MCRRRLKEEDCNCTLQDWFPQSSSVCTYYNRSALSLYCCMYEENCCFRCSEIPFLCEDFTLNSKLWKWKASDTRLLMCVSQSGCGCYLGLSPGNNKRNTVLLRLAPQTYLDGEGDAAGWGSVEKNSCHGGVKERNRSSTSSVLLAKVKPRGKVQEGELAWYQVSTCWEIADGLAVRNHCQVKNGYKNEKNRSRAAHGLTAGFT